MSDKDTYRLHPATVVEPLVNRFVAWSHVLAPVPYSLHLRHYQLSVLESYLKDPRVHVRACQDPKLRSGPLVDIPAERAPEVAAFLSETRRTQAANLRLADELVEFHNRLVDEAQGQSLEPYYDQVPEGLRGYVELIYDYYNRPTVRCLEGMMYDSPFYDAGNQSVRLFRQTTDDERPFFMSTPRLPGGEGVEWAVPFAAAEIDELCRLDRTPQPLGRIREILGLTGADDERLLPLLTTAPAPAPRPAPADDEVRVRYFGHACVLIEWRGVSILTDPCVGVVPEAGGMERLSYADLPEHIDYALVTHGHHDHFCMETLLRLRHRLGCLVVPRSYGLFYGDISLKTLARRTGFQQVVEMDNLESIPLPDGEIVAVPFLGEHADLPHSKSAYVVRAGRERLLFAADSDCLDPRLYEHVRRVVGPVQNVFIGMECVGAPLTWSCGSFLPRRPAFHLEQSRRYKGCDAERAWSLLEAVGAERLYIYAMGLEPWYEYLLGLALTDDSPQRVESGQLLRRARELGFADARLLYGSAELLLKESEAAEPHLFAAATVAPQAPEDEFQFD